MKGYRPTSKYRSRLGYSYPVAIGAKVAFPDRPVVCFGGDGGFLMGSMEIATAMKYGLNVVVIVVNDDALSAIKESQDKEFEGRTIDTDLYNPDFVEFANSFGAYARRVEIWETLNQFCVMPWMLVNLKSLR